MTRNDFKRTITQAIDEIKKERGDSFDLSKINLAELERRTGVSRAKLRRLKRNGFVFKSHGNAGHKAGATVLAGFERYIDELLTHGVSNSNVFPSRSLTNNSKDKRISSSVFRSNIPLLPDENDH